MKVLIIVVVSAAVAAAGGYVAVEASRPPKASPITNIGIISKPVDGAFVK